MPAPPSRWYDAELLECSASAFLVQHDDKKTSGGGVASVQQDLAANMS
jgi:hypothetical protein